MSHAARAYVRDTRTLRAGDVARSLALLSVDERARCRRLAFDEDRRDFAAAHALLRMAIAQETGDAPDALRFVADSNGKPVLAGRDDVSFSLTHARGLVACVVAREGEVGIDAESVDRRVSTIDVARRFFAPEEANEAKCHHRFFQLWTMKEAYAKARGIPLESALRSPLADLKGWSFEVRELGGTHVLAIVTRLPVFRGRWK